MFGEFDLFIHAVAVLADDQVFGVDLLALRVAHAQQHLEVERLHRRAQRHDGLHLKEQALDLRVR